MGMNQRQAEKSKYAPLRSKYAPLRMKYAPLISKYAPLEQKYDSRIYFCLFLKSISGMI